MYEKAKKVVENYDQNSEYYQLLGVYIEGVNQCISEKTCRNLETFLLELLIPIEEWKKEDTAALSKLFTFFMIHDFYQEVGRSYLDAAFKGTEYEDFATEVLGVSTEKNT